MADVLLILSIVTIWIAVFESVIIMAGAVRFIFKQNKKELMLPGNMDDYPAVTVMVPAHNEELVITATAEHILKMNYPEEKVQLIVIADNCSDNTAGRLKALKEKTSYKDRDFVILERKGTGGKSGALKRCAEAGDGRMDLRIRCGRRTGAQRTSIPDAKGDGEPRSIRRRLRPEQGP